MNKKILSILLITSSLFATQNLSQKECAYKNNDNIKVTWIAFKTPMKLGVGGTFDSVTFTKSQNGTKDLKSLLLNSSVKIDTKSVNSNNKTRDQKLIKSFFDLMKNETILAKIVDIDDKTVTIKLTMNDITKDIPLRYSYEDGKLKASGVIDLFDFQASKALSSINKACYELHKGKTWNDVTIGFEIAIECK